MSREGANKGVLAANLTATMAVGPLLVFAVGALAPRLMGEFALTRTQLGVLTPAAFLIAAAGGYLGGHLPDRFGPRRILVGLYTCAFASFVMFAAAWGFAGLVIALALSGIGMSLTNPVTNALIGRVLPPGERGVVMGLKQSGVPMGQFVAGTALPIGAVVWGWRGVLVVIAALPLVGITASLLTLPADPPSADLRASRASGSVDASVWILSLYSFVLAVVLQSTGVYVSLYAFEEVGLDSTWAGIVVGVFGGVGIAARILWGRIAERQRTISSPLVLLAGLAGLSMVGLLFAEHVGAWLLWVGAMGFGASALSVNVVVMLAVFRIAAADAVGRATGVIMLGMYSGFVVGPPVFGSVADALGSYTLGWAGAAGLCLFGMLVGGWLRRRGL